MINNKKNWTRYSFIADLVLWMLFMFVLGANWLVSLFFTQIVMWIVRMTWMSPLLQRFVLKRFLHMIPIILTTVAMGFAMIQLAPGDIFAQLALSPNVRPEDLERMRQNFGLGLPWYEQFVRYVFNILRGEFGYSQLYRAPVFTIVNQRMLNTLLLSVPVIILGWVISIPAGIVAATKQYKVQDQVISILAFIGLSLPNFFFAFLAVYFMSRLNQSVGFSILPLGGFESVTFNQMNIFQQLVDRFRHLVIPVTVLTAGTLAGLTRVMRANMLEIMNMQYITTARAKGLEEKVVIWKHALRNAINPMITMFGFQLGTLLGGAALVENVLAWPGLGQVMLRAIMSQDLYLVIGSLIYGVFLLMLGNLIADVLLGVVDPRVRIS